MATNRNGRAMVLTAAAALLATGSTRAASPTPEDILKERGLTRQGVYFVIASEAEVFDALLKVKPFMVRMATAGDKVIYQHQLAELVQSLKDELIGTRQQIFQLQAAIARSRPRNELEREQVEAMEVNLGNLQSYFSQTNAQLVAAQSRQAGPRQMEKLEEDFKVERDKFLKVVTTIRPVYDKVMKEYAALQTDSIVSNAVNVYGGLNKFKAKLGPSLAMVKGIGAVKEAERTYSPETAAPRVSSKARAKAKAKAKGRGNGRFVMPQPPPSAPAVADTEAKASEP